MTAQKIVLLCAGLMAAACDGSSDPNGEGGASPTEDGGTNQGDESLTPEQACLAAADGFADVCERCQLDTYQNCYQGFLQQANGSCSNVGSIRDVTELEK